MTMKLHYQLQNNPSQNEQSIIFLHGLFGDLANLGMLARAFSQHYQTIQIDLRNHGKSPHCEQMTYRAMAKDIVNLCDHLNLKNVIIVGHSMGGKVAMTIPSIAPQKIIGLVILDIAPITYTLHQHDDVFAALQAVTDKHATTRNTAHQIMRQFLSDEATINFLLKSFQQGQWLFNIHALRQNYSKIAGWQELSPWYHPILFLKGTLSSYIQDENSPSILAQFPKAEIEEIKGTGHWLHAEKTIEVVKSINFFISNLLLTDK